MRGKKEPTIDEQISSQKPFGLRTFFQGEKVKKDGWIKVYANHNVGYVSPDMISQNASWIDKHKIILPRAIGSGDSKEDLVKPIYSELGSCCTETYVVLGPYHNKNEIDNYDCPLNHDPHSPTSWPSEIGRFCILVQAPHP